MKPIIAYEVRGQLDSCEGRSGTYLVGFFNSKEVADKAALKKGVWDRPGDVSVCSGFLVDVGNGEEKFVRPEDFHTIIYETQEDVVARAKAKLSADEIRALGLK